MEQNIIAGWFGEVFWPVCHVKSLWKFLYMTTIGISLIKGNLDRAVQFYCLIADSPKDTNITTDAPQDTVSDGSLITITCKAHGNPPPRYKFFIENKPIYDRKAERTGILKLTAMSFSQSGIYSCRPENDRGKGPRKDVTVYVRRK